MTFEEVIEIAEKQVNKAAFKKNCRKAYDIARINGWLNLIFKSKLDTKELNMEQKQQVKKNIITFIKNNRRLPDFNFDNDPLEKSLRDAHELFMKQDKEYNQQVTNILK